MFVGAEYKIHQESLPEIIDLGAVSLNEPKNFEVKMFPHSSLHR